MGRNVIELKLDLINDILLLPVSSPLKNYERIRVIKDKLVKIHQTLNYIEALYEDLIEK